MKKISLVFAFGILLSATCLIFSCKSSQTSASKPLHLKLDKGNAYDYEMTEEMNEAMMDMNVATKYSIEVTAEEGDMKILGITYSGIKMSMGIGQMHMNFDTDKPSTDSVAAGERNPFGMANKVFATLKGKRLQLKVDKEGDIKEISGMEDLYSGFLDSAKGMSDAKKEEMQSMIKKQVNGNEAKAQLAELFYFFPSKDVKVGDTWEKSFESSMPAMGTNEDSMGISIIRHVTKFKVKDIDGEMVTLTSDTKIEPVGKEGAMTGAQKGTLVVDSRSGLLAKADYDQEFNLNIMGMTMTMRGKLHIVGKAR